MNALTLAPLHRPATTNVGQLRGSQTERFSFDFVIDGVSLYEQVAAATYDLVGALGWLPHNENRAQIAQLLLRAKAPVPGGRQMIFVCPECGDLACGAITCEVVRDGPTVVWQTFALETGYEDGTNDFESLRHIGPFRFSWQEYAQVLDTSGTARSNEEL